MYAEDDLLPISALQHLVFCERQCALIYLEGVWEDNPLTVEGSHLHERARESGPRSELRGDTLIARDLALRSLRLGLSGRADLVEFHRVAQGGVCLPEAKGLWLPFPVEYKRGRPKKERCDEVQLCAQAMCLEEMLGTSVPRGALFYGATRRRFGVVFDDRLRVDTESASMRLRELIARQVTPLAVLEPKCRNCSLIEVCMPEVSRRRAVQRYLRAALERNLAIPEVQEE